MKFTRFFGLFLALFALVLLFSGCDLLPFGKDDNKPDNPDPKPNTKNGSVFHLQHTDKKHIFISIYSATNSTTSSTANSIANRQITPQAGDYYAVVVLAESKNGSVTYTGEPDSTGKLTAAGIDGKFNFVPDDDFEDQEAGIGSINGTNLIMEKIPGTEYKNISLPHLQDDTLSATNLFGNIDIQGTGGGNDNTSSSESVFKPGKYVIGVKWANQTPTITTKVYEGREVTLPSNTSVIVTYNDGSTASTVVNATSFYIDPPYYKIAGGTHYLIYIGEYYDTSTADAPKFYAPTDSTSSSGSTITNFYTLNTPLITGLDNLKYFEGYGFDFSGVTIKGTYQTGTPSTATAFTPYSDLYNKHAVLASDKTNVTFYFGNTSTTTSLSTYYELSGIEILDAAFKEQITFDDPRFFSSSASAHWYSHLSDASIGLKYNDTAKQQKISVAKAAMGRNFIGTSQDFKLNITLPTAWTSNVLEFTYSKGSPATSSVTTTLEIPLYDTLSKVDITSKNGKRILLDGAKPDNRITFLGQVNVSAIYQIGYNKGNTVRKPVFIGNLFSEFNDWNINGTYETNVSTSGILNSGNSSAWNKNQKPQKASITLKAFQGNYTGDKTITAGTDLTIVTGTIEVGVTGY